MHVPPQKISIQDFTYDLPDERIAARPLPRRDGSKLLVYRNGTICDDHFYHLPQQLPEGATLVLNNTRVIEARLHFQKPTGGVIEIFCLEPSELSMEEALGAEGSVDWACLIGGASKWKPGQLLQKDLPGSFHLTAQYIRKEEDSFVIRFSWTPQQLTFAEVLHRSGAIPLPPYIKRLPTEEDKERYQTIFSRVEGSVAAPTASLHFTPEVFRQLAEKNIHPSYLTLHVGAGTFRPVKSETMEGHHMHAEPFTVTKTFLEKLAASETVVVAGTTALRTVESLHWLGVKLLKEEGIESWKLDQWEAYQLLEKFGPIPPQETIRALVDWMTKEEQRELHCQTSLLIVPGYPIQIPHALITNFHQPQSTLLLLVAAFAGADWKKIYRHALEHDYRFLSYGDSSLLWRR